MDDHPHFYFEEDGQLVDAAKSELKIAALSTPPEGYEVAKLDVVVRLRKRG
jgi:Fur family iron response transcriptional regulator